MCYYMYAIELPRLSQAPLKSLGLLEKRVSDFSGVGGWSIASGPCAASERPSWCSSGSNLSVAVLGLPKRTSSLPIPGQLKSMQSLRSLISILKVVPDKSSGTEVLQLFVGEDLRQGINDVGVVMAILQTDPDVCVDEPANLVAQAVVWRPSFDLTVVLRRPHVLPELGPFLAVVG